jgi:hypothetical protein
LPHVDLLHLIFNVYWLWVFGTAVEAEFGRLRTAAIFAFFAAGSDAAEYAVFNGGVGLSGIGYGLFGLLWILSSRDERFRDAVDSQTIGLFVVWFFLCILLTVGEIWAVGNVAHGMGAVQGILLGFAVTTGRGKSLAFTGLTGLMLATFAAATVGRPFVNLSDHSGEDLAYAGYVELEADGNERAAALYERAVRYNDRDAAWWYNLGVAYDRLGRTNEATEAFRRAVKLDPDSAPYRQFLAQWLSALAYNQQTAGEYEAAISLYRDSLNYEEQDAQSWFNLGIAYESVGRAADAINAYEKAVALDSDNDKFRAALDAAQQPAEQ